MADSGWKLQRAAGRCETRLAKRLKATMLGRRSYISRYMSRPTPPSGLRLEDWFEFFLSARLQFGCGNSKLWCDGAYALDIVQSRSNHLKVKGVALVCDGRSPGSHLRPRTLKFFGVMRLPFGSDSPLRYHLMMRGLRPGALWGWRGRFLLRSTSAALDA